MTWPGPGPGRPDGWTFDPELVALRKAIGRRLEALARDRHGPGGGYPMARELGVSPRSWDRWCEGDTMPGEVLLKLIDITGAEPLWILRGTGPPYRDYRPAPPDTSGVAAAAEDLTGPLWRYISALRLAANLSRRRARQRYDHDSAPDGRVRPSG